MRLRQFCILLAPLIIFIAGCSHEIAGDEKTAIQYIESHGYRAASKDTGPASYTLDESKLKTMPHMMYWSVQDARPEDYLGKEITVVGYKVKNHPLEETYGAPTVVQVMLSEGMAIGGYSYPDIDGSAGWVYSIDGKTLEEKTGMSYKDWSEAWNKQRE